MKAKFKIDKYRILVYLTIIISMVVLRYFSTIGCSSRCDFFWQYRISNAIAHGAIIYKDINSPVTPLYHWITAIPNIFIKGMIGKMIMDDLLIIITNILAFELLNPIIKNKKKLFVVMLSLINIMGFGHGYNTMLVLWGLIILHLNNMCVKKPNIYIYIVTGILAFCCILTKQTVGTVMAILELCYFAFSKNKKGFYLCATGFLFSGFIFLGYLLVTNSIVEFFDYCLFGITKFSHKYFDYSCFIIVFPFFISTIVLAIQCLKNKNIKDKQIIVFVCCMALISYPIFEFVHIKPFIYSATIGIFLIEWKKQIAKNFYLIFTICLGFVCFATNIGKPNGEFFHTKFATNKYQFIYEETAEMQDIEQQYGYKVIKCAGNTVLNEVMNDDYSEVMGMFLGGNIGTKTPEEWMDITAEDHIIAMYGGDYGYESGQFPMEAYEYVKNNYNLIYSSNTTRLEYFVKKENSK